MFMRRLLGQTQASPNRCSITRVRNSEKLTSLLSLERVGRQEYKMGLCFCSYRWKRKKRPLHFPVRHLRMAKMTYHCNIGCKKRAGKSNGNVQMILSLQTMTKASCGRSCLCSWVWFRFWFCHDGCCQMSEWGNLCARHGQVGSLTLPVLPALCGKTRSQTFVGALKFQFCHTPPLSL